MKERFSDNTNMHIHIISTWKKATVTGNAAPLTRTGFAQNSDTHHNPQFIFINLWQVGNLHWEVRKYWLSGPLVAKSSIPASFKY